MDTQVDSDGEELDVSNTIGEEEDPHTPVAGEGACAEKTDSSTDSLKDISSEAVSKISVTSVSLESESNLLDEDGDEESHLPEGIPYMQLFVLICAILCDALGVTFLFPFVSFMVADFHVSEDEKEVGRYAGLLAACFSFAQFLSSFWYGMISDRIGRRPVSNVPFQSLVSIFSC